MIVEVDLKSIKNNLKNLRLSYGKSLIFMVKANAYGHGLKEVVSNVGETAYGVATAQEGQSARLCTDNKVIVTTPIARDMRIIRDFSLIPCIGDIECVKASISANISECHIAVNSGMNRLGFYDDESLVCAVKLLAKNHIEITGLCTHYKQSDKNNILAQNAVFDRYVNIVKKQLYSLGINNEIITHVTGTAASYSQNYDVLRVGLSAYGYLCDSENLVPSMRVYSEIIKIKEIITNDTLGYNGIFRADKNTRCATILGGYADGISRDEIGRKVIVNGKLASLVAVCMDTSEIVVDNIDCKVGDSVIIMSKEISAEYIAKKRETIPYEVLVGYDRHRNIKEYLDD